MKKFAVDDPIWCLRASPIVNRRDLELEGDSLRGGLSFYILWNCSPHLRNYRRKAGKLRTDRSRPGIKLDISRLPVLRAEPLGHWLGNDPI